MNKLKKQNTNILLNYQHFLKNNSLKKKKFKLKNIVFENQILYKNQDLNIIELNNSENIKIPSTVRDLNEISTINTVYKDELLFDYNLNYNILYNFNKILFNYIKKKNIIKGRVVTGNKKITLIAFLGIISPMKSINLNNLINLKKNIKRKNFNKSGFKSKRFFYSLKKMKIEKVIRTYKLRYLNFKIKHDENIFSRYSYIEDIIEALRIKNLKKEMILKKNKKKIKSNFFRNEYVNKKNKSNKMPQFDQFSFFNQVSWFLFFFLNFYFFITYFLLPKICYNLKFRKKKIIINNQKKNQINFEKNNIIFFFNNSYKLFCLNFESFLVKKLFIYKLNENNKVKEQPLINKLLKQKINIFLNQRFLLFKKIFINI